MTASEREVRTVWRAVIFAGLASALAFAAAIHGKELATSTHPVNVNTASVEMLQTLPRVGPKLAQKIVDGRPYKDLEALDAVKGVGPKMLEALRPLVTFGVGEKP